VPSVEEVTVTVLPLTLGVPMPRAVAQVPVSAVRMFVARPAVLDAAAKLAVMPVPEPVHVAFEPLVPAVLTNWVKLPVLDLEAVGTLPSTVATTFMTLAAGVVQPVAATPVVQAIKGTLNGPLWQLLIAVAKLST